MIIRTYWQCLKVLESKDIYIATDDKRVQKVCEEVGAQVLLTSKNCLTGTDRIAECVSQVVADTYINVQGDEPIFNPLDIGKLIEVASEYPDEIINGYCSIKKVEMFNSSSTPKVVMRIDGRLLYISRGAIPTNKKSGFNRASRQICAYAFPRKALLEFSSMNEKTPLESIEDIEILRFLELGWDVRMIPMSDSSVPVDNPGDVAKVEQIIERNSSDYS